MKKCEEYELAISAYVDGEIAHHERSVLFAHLSSCERCDRFLRAVIRIRIDATRESDISAPGDIAPSFVSVESNRVLQYSLDHPAVALASKPRSIGSLIRTLALAILIIVIGCLMFSTTVTFGTRGESAIQPTQENGVR